MKIGVRKRSYKKSFSAKTSAKYKRRLKKAIIPGYGKKGTGIWKNPKKALYNKAYNKVTIDRRDLFKPKKKKRSSTKKVTKKPTVVTPVKPIKFSEEEKKLIQQAKREIPKSFKTMLISGLIMFLTAIFGLWPISIIAMIGTVVGIVWYSIDSFKDYKERRKIRKENEEKKE